TATGVYGFGQTGVYGQGDYAGVQGSGPIGLFGSSTSGNGVYAYTETGQEAVIGRNLSTAYGARGVFGEIHSTQPGGSSSAVLGVNNGTGASGIGVWGSQDGTGYGVLGETLNGGYAVVGDNGGSNTSGYAGSFNGRVAVVGTLTKGGGSFKIDHPLDPANKYLYHSFVESPDMKNIYDGVVTLDENGRAVVTMPDWFEALNQNFRYQLTAIGASMPDLYVSEKISDNHFAIAGGQPGGEVSWQVTGIRHDPFAEAYRIPVEEDKTGSEKGHYLYPEVYGKSVQDSVWYASSPNARYNIDHPEGPQQPDLNDPLGQ
ncbi:MAG: hypothetical protein KDI03_12450, partial [Anaerolineae bacterium]|nr:hypothetical protein [Anaerolineae bacterium]